MPLACVASMITDAPQHGSATASAILVWIAVKRHAL